MVAYFFSKADYYVHVWIWLIFYHRFDLFFELMKIVYANKNFFFMLIYKFSLIKIVSLQVVLS
jgi:hypothetical protein